MKALTGRLLIAFLVMGVSAVVAEAAVTLARGGQPALPIVLDSGIATPAEKTAAQELQAYLGKLTGAEFQVVEAGTVPLEAPAVWVGVTRFARMNGVEPMQLGPEESVLKTVGGSLILAGGRPRGTLYAVYELLEKHLGVRWYTPWDEHVPLQPDLQVAALDERVRPAYLFRANYCHLYDKRMYEDHEGFLRFMVRNRQNMEGPSAEWGGGIKRGRAGNHSFALLVPTDKYFADHPEYFSMRKGERVPTTGVDGNHLCLTNAEVLRIVIDEVKKDCVDYPEATYISVSIGDGGNPTICDCPACRAVAEEEGESGLLLQFVNQVADAIREEYPDKYILTLAYNATAAAPKRIAARDNVIVYVCTGGRTALCHFPEGMQAGEYQVLRDWAKMAKHVWAWDYANAVFRGMHFFRPMTWQMYDQFQLYRELASVDGVMQENEYHGGNDVCFAQFYEMNMWIFARLCQDPTQKLDPLIDDFLTGYYGPAAPALRRYVDLLAGIRRKYPYHMMSWAFIRDAQQCFEEAEAAAGADAEVLARVRDLRLQLDMATVAWRNQIINDYLAQGGAWEEYPFKLATMKQRITAILDKAQNPYLLGKVAVSHEVEEGKWQYTFDPLQSILRPYVEKLCTGQEYAPLPERFRDLPADRLIDLDGATFARNSSDGPDVFVDPEAALGLCWQRMSDRELPMPIGVWSPDKVRPLNDAKSIKAEQVPGPGYHWYEGPRFSLREWSYVYLTGSWRFQVPLWSEWDSAHPEQEWQVWISGKFTGPAYPGGRPEDENGFWVDRVILAPVAGQAD